MLETVRIANELIALARRPIHWMGADISAAAVDLMSRRQSFPGSKVQLSRKDNTFSAQHITKMKEVGNGMSFEGNGE